MDELNKYLRILRLLWALEDEERTPEFDEFVIDVARWADDNG